jgi:hypothetical protein
MLRGSCHRLAENVVSYVCSNVLTIRLLQKINL